MAEFLKWGSFGDVLFEFLTSPERGSVRSTKGARYNERKRIVSRGSDGKLAGQKPLKDIAGLDLNTISFRCKISTIVLKAISLNTVETLALAAGIGPLAGSALGDTSEDRRFYTDVDTFMGTLDAVLDNQEPHPLTIGSKCLGLYTLNSLRTQETHRQNGDIYIAEIDIDLSEWVAQ